MKKRGGKLRQKTRQRRRKGKKRQNKARRKRLARKETRRSKSKERTRRGKFGNQESIEFMDGTKERELDSQLSFCTLKKKISVGPAMKVLD